MKRIALLGDSILDNAPYVAPGQAVIDTCLTTFPAHWDVMLLAVDGSTTDDVIGQLARVPPETTDLVISCGGNDALGHLGILQAPCSRLHAALAILAPLVAAFERTYATMLALAKGSAQRVAVCTVYDAVPGLDAPTRLALSLFNDVIQRTAWREGVALLDMRAVLTETVDFSAASPIEPSTIGSRKIAQALHDSIKRQEQGDEH